MSKGIMDMDVRLGCGSYSERLFLYNFFYLLEYVKLISNGISYLFQQKNIYHFHKIGRIL